MYYVELNGKHKIKTKTLIEKELNDKHKMKMKTQNKKELIRCTRGVVTYRD
jgi:hypothetical protein